MGKLLSGGGAWQYQGSYAYRRDLPAFFPPLIRNGRPFLNSSPAFNTIDAEYLCVNVPYQTRFDAIDKDGDELRYSLVTPFNSFYNFNNLTESEYLGMANYPLVQWAEGYGPEMAMGGKPELAIDRQTGVLTVTPTQLGLYTFTVLVDEYRRGEWIGSTRRDYQFLVIDCPPIYPPDPQVRVLNFPEGVSSVRICKGAAVELVADKASDWVYQWRKDGRFIYQATDPVLKVSESGVYSVDIAFKTECGRSVKSRQLQVMVVGMDVPISTSTRTVCTGKIAELSTTSAPGLLYSWQRDGLAISGADKSGLSTEEPGIYTVKVSDPTLGCPASESDPVEITKLSSPQMDIIAKPDQDIVCEGEVVKLSVAANTGYRYQWRFDGTPIPGATANTYEVTRSGGFSLEITDDNGCRGVSGSRTFEFHRQVNVTMEPLPVFCLGDSSAHLLKGYPDGGTYSGKGITGDRFIPFQAGEGSHEVAYTVQSGALSCAQGKAIQVATVTSPPVPVMPEVIRTRKGEPVVLPGNVGTAYSYLWSPEQGLSAINVAEPYATVNESTVYRLTITDANGCASVKEIRIAVETRLQVPNAFSPNGDGLNDVWELNGVEDFPGLEVFVYDRWGSVIFYSAGYQAPWDGKVRGKMVQPGYYVYRVRAAGFEHTGSITVLY